MKAFIINNRNLVSRFSNSLANRGKKVEGHKLLFSSLFLLTLNQERESLNLNLQKAIAENKADKNRFLFSIGFTNKSFQSFALFRSALFSPSARKESNGLLKERKCFQKQINHLQKQNTIRDNFNVDSAKADLLSPNKKIDDSSEKLSYDDKSQVRNQQFCKKCVDHIKPILETRKVRKGRQTHRVPLVTKIGRQEGTALSWIVDSASSRRNKVKNEITLFSSSNQCQPSLQSKLSHEKKKQSSSLKYCLAEQLKDAFQGKGESFNKKKEIHQLALQNRAYTHYRWW